MRFFGATQDYAGLGFAVRLQEEGHQVLLATNPDKTEIANPEVCRRYQRVGAGIVEKVPLHSVDENETLRAEGFRVLGGGRHAYTVEHDRKTCLDFVGRHGLEAPPSLDFERPSDAIIFLRASRRHSLWIQIGFRPKLSDTPAGIRGSRQSES
jgi:hypothetical protein